MRHSPAVDDIELAQRLQKRRVQQRSATDLPAVVLLAVLFAQSRRTADGVAIDVERHDRRTELPRRQAEQSAPAPCIEKSPTLQIVGLQQLPHRLLSLLDPVRVEQPEKTSPVSSELKVVRPITGHGGGCRVVRQFSPVCRAIRRNGVAENRDPICVWRVRGSVNCGWRIRTSRSAAHAASHFRFRPGGWSERWNPSPASRGAGPELSRNSTGPRGLESGSSSRAAKSTPSAAASRRRVR